jgi:SAM-dependent methyltransferase
MLGAFNARVEGRLWYRPAFPSGIWALDLGCGPAKLPGAIGMDIARLAGVDVIGNIERGLPFGNDTFDVVYASNLMEHIRDLTGLMREIHRVLKKGGILMVATPYCLSHKAFQDPTHVRFFSLDTFEYFCREQNVAPSWYFDFSFQRVRRKALVFRTMTIIYNPIFGLLVNLSPFFQRLYEKSFLSAFQADELQIEIVK